MKIKQLFKLLRRDDRKLEDIFKRSVEEVGVVKFNPICGLVKEEGICSKEEIRAFKFAKPISVSMKEPSSYE